jgi:signal transduction histidine kinase/DNA-binding response OmpR family regulator
MSKEIEKSKYLAEILIAEDSPTQAAHLKYLLESYQYKVKVTQNGLEALVWLSNNKPSLIISDVVMPEMTGFELCEKVKSDVRTENIPLILLTSLSDPEEVLKGLSCGADSFITKPYNEDYLISNVERILSETSDYEYKKDKLGIEINYGGKKRLIHTEPQKLVKLLLNIYQGAIYQNKELIRTQDELRLFNERLEEIVEQRTAELMIANEELAFQNEEKEKKAAKLIIANEELVFQNKEKEKRAAELIIANKELAFQNIKKEKRAAELIIANEELQFQNEEKEKRAEELIIANIELDFQNEEKGKRAAELGIANKELVFQNLEKEKRAAELIIANKELIFQNEEKEKRAAELIMANNELIFQNGEKEKRAAELIIANKELIFQNEEKGKRAAELVIADKELVYQTKEKGKRAAELVIADKELEFQNEEKGKRAEELIIANEELAFQSEEKGKLAAELIIADKEIVFQSEEKEKQEAANKELEAFSYSVSHDLRAPLRHIGGFVDLLIKNNASQLDEKGLRYLNTIAESSTEMGNLIDALLTFSRLSRTELQRTQISSKIMVTRVLQTFTNELIGREVEINISDLPDLKGDETLMNQVWINLISNALKYSRNEAKAVIDIGGVVEKDVTIFHVKDNGAGFDMQYADKLFGVFQRLHKSKDFEGIGIGLANVSRIIVRHGGKCWAESEIGQGAKFFFSVPNM